jgi:hypothetical protein
MRELHPIVWQTFTLHVLFFDRPGRTHNALTSMNLPESFGCYAVGGGAVVAQPAYRACGRTIRIAMCCTGRPTMILAAENPQES